VHGTQPATWFKGQSKFLQRRGLVQADVPPETDFEGRASLLNRIILAHMDQDRQVVVDGHSLHKTAINVAAGRVALPGAVRGTPVQELVDGCLRPYFSQLSSPGIMHTHVVLPPEEVAAADAGLELQRRLGARGDRSAWDPATPDESLAQAWASDQLEGVLRRQGAVVLRAFLPSLPA
jgi:hypothetical protein